jgi:anion-transporting  ArsA/GET3 family ATPase
MEKYEMGWNKKSFELPYGGGAIWCEHLDSLCGQKELVMQKFSDDLNQIKKPSTTSFIAVILDETAVDEELAFFILRPLMQLEKPLRKVVFVGLHPKMKKIIQRESCAVPFKMKCIDDLEKAKEWLVH